MSHITGAKTFRPRSFPLGQVLPTPGALGAVEDSQQTCTEFLARHLACDWGDVCDDDKQLNDDALNEGSRILSAYQTRNGVKLWIITEAADDDGGRAATTILLPDEY